MPISYFHSNFLHQFGFSRNMNHRLLQSAPTTNSPRPPMNHHDITDSVFFLSPTTYATSRTEHVNANSVTVQTNAALTDSEGKELYPQGSFFSICAPIGMRCIPAIRYGEEVDVIMVHDQERKVTDLNTHKNIITVICSRETNIPFDLNDNDVRACVQTVVKYVFDFFYEAYYQVTFTIRWSLSEMWRASAYTYHILFNRAYDLD